MRLALAAVVLALCTACGSARASDVPFLSGRVVDDAEVLSSPVRESLDAKLRAEEQRSTDQVVVLTVRTIGDESIESYADRVFQDWKLGVKGKDNGVLVVVAPHDHKMRIEVGYGLEGTLTDVQAARIIRNVMTPAFKADDFNAGITAGVDAVLAVLGGGTVAESSGAASGSSASGFISNVDLPPWPMRILLGAFIFGIIGLFTVVGVATPGIGWILYVFLIPFWAMFPIMVIGTHPTLIVLCIYVVAFPLAKLWVSRLPWYAKARVALAKSGTTTIGGMTVSSGSGSWSSGGGGGFSGGGGSSGGGGASGSW